MTLEATLAGKLENERETRVARLLRWAAGALLLVGLVVRIAPLFDDGGRLLSQFPTEDGYMMLTVSRNLAIGKGMSIADGTILTNGVQPLATFLWSVFFVASGGDRSQGVAGVLLCETGLALASAYLLLLLGRRLFARVTLGLPLAEVVAAVWFASPVVVWHTMNCLESGVYVGAVLAVTLAFFRASADTGPWPWKTVVSIGALLGLAFWSRNDAVFLGVAVAAAHVGLRGTATLGRRVLEVCGFAGVAGLIGAPWVLHNLAKFGHAVPISGQSESMDAAFGSNLGLLPIGLAEGLSVVVPIPFALEQSLLVRLGAALFVLGVGIPLVVVAYRRATAHRRLIVLGAGFWIILVVYYGLFFGAAHFLARYMFPTTPLSALLLGAALLHAAGRLRRPVGDVCLLGAVSVALVLSIGLGVRTYLTGTRHQHFQVVAWVQNNVPETSWVGAAQSGTLGFFHDRTINLDGKVNPEALEARRAKRVPEYALGKGVDFIADWADFAWWVTLPGFKSQLELLVHDREQNLAVLRRKGARTLPEQREAR